MGFNLPGKTLDITPQNFTDSSSTTETEFPITATPYSPSVYLSNYCYYSYAEGSAYLAGYPLNIHYGIGALDGCVPLLSSTNELFLLGGRQISGPYTSDKGEPNTDATKYYTIFEKKDITKISTQYNEISDVGTGIMVQPYGMVISPEFIGKIIPKYKKFPGWFTAGTVNTYDFIPDTLPYGCLYSDGLKFPDKDIWLIPTTGWPISDDPEVRPPPMLIAELMPEGWNSEVTDDDAKYFYKFSRFRITPLLTSNNQEWIPAIYSNPNFGSCTRENEGPVGRGWGDHGLIKIGDNKYQYFNFVNDVVINIELSEGKFVSINAYQTWSHTKTTATTTYATDTTNIDLES
jgi:hypothetical protein